MTVVAELTCPHCGRQEPAECELALLPYNDSYLCEDCGEMVFEEWSRAGWKVAVKTNKCAFAA